MKIVLDLIRNQPADKAMAILRHTPKAASECLEKLLKSAMANAEVKEMNTASLYVAECFVCPGPTLKRFQARDKGPRIQNTQENQPYHTGSCREKNKTRIVAIADRVAHPLYKKIVGRTYKLKAHDENNECGIGDTVKVMETAPVQG